MKLKPPTNFRLILILLFVFTVSAQTVLFTGCGSSADAANKEKSKKKKKIVEEDEEDEEVKEEKSSEETEKTEESNSENSNTETPEKENSHSDSDKKEQKSDDKHSDKKGDKESKDHKKDSKDDGRSADAIWQDLMKGNSRFVSGKHTNIQFASVRKTLTSGQKPEVIILGCADSRVPPELVFDKNLGELFVVRAAGNIADLVELGSIEYAIEHLHSKVLVVLGHESCGAVAAAVSNEKMPTKNLTAIVDQIAPAFEGSKTCPLGGKMNNSCVELNVKRSAEDVLANSPIIKKAVKEGELTIIRAVYQLESGKVVRMD